jgi:hypothetical protein
MELGTQPPGSRLAAGPFCSGSTPRTALFLTTLGHRQDNPGAVVLWSEQGASPRYPRRRHVHSVSAPQKIAILDVRLRLKEAAMKAWTMKVRLIALIAATCCSIGIGARSVSAQTVTVSPTSESLSFGVPTGSTTSAPQAVTVSVSGSGSVTVSNINIAGTSDFAQSNTCANPISAPGSCVINVTFTPHSLAGTLESATLTFNASGADGAFSFALTGALGAIRLFDPINVATSNPSASFSNMLTLGSTTLNLSCPAGATATISSKPDGSGNVVVDNYITLVVNNQPFGSGQPTGNVCTGGVSDLNGNIAQQDCFTQPYRDAAGDFGANGEDPDNFAATWGVAPINLASAFVNEGATTPTATFTELDAGRVYTGTTLFLATNCSLTNANTGTETGNPVSQQPSQTLSFDTVFNHLDQYGFDYSFLPSGSITNFNSTPTVTNNSITPAQYSALVANTPFASTACIPLNSLNGNCALKTQVCVPSDGSAQTATGAQCPQTPKDDFLFTSTFDPSTLITDPHATFGSLEFNDQGTCPLEGPEANSPCPQNGLVSFAGPGEYNTRRGAGSTNSATVVTTALTPPTTTVVVTPFFPVSPGVGWTNGHPTATFIGTPGPTTPAVAPIKFIEFGVNPQIGGLPPTFPLPFPGNATFSQDSVQTNPSTCPATYPAAAAPFGPNPPASLGSFADGSVNLLNYSTTDCANTHELQFSFNTGKWSTSFKSLTLMTDTVPPAITLTTPPPSGGHYSANQKVKANYSCLDGESGVATCAGTVANGSNIDTTPTNGLSTTKTFTVNSSDNVGNAGPASTTTYTVNCNYAAVTLSPTSIIRPAFVTVSTSVVDCMTAPQTVKVKFTLSGPLGRNCSNSSTVMFTTPSFTIRSGTSSSFSFPFFVGKNVCAGTYTITTTTLQGSSTIDTVMSTLMVH